MNSFFSVVTSAVVKQLDRAFQQAVIRHRAPWYKLQNLPNDLQQNYKKGAKARCFCFQQDEKKININKLKDSTNAFRVFKIHSYQKLNYLEV